jgi:iron complex transport system ATP-binding protein
MSLVVHSLSYAYRRRRAEPVLAVDDVSLSIASGSFTGLLGPNGCGKTTLLRLLSGVEQPNSGRVEFDGRDVRTYTRRALARRIAVVPQETHPAFDYAVLDMVLMGRHPFLGTFEFEGPEDHHAARLALAATDTADLADRPFSALSGGEKQRVVIASALAQAHTALARTGCAPGEAGNVLLLDEPTASLDLGAQLDEASLLQGLHRERGATKVMATHDLNLAASICDRLVLMKSGRVLASGPTADVLTGALVQELYDIDADVRFHEEAGHLTVTPLKRTRRSDHRRQDQDLAP